MAEVTAGGIWSETRAVVARHAGVFATLAGATVFLPNAATRLLAPATSARGVDAATAQLPTGLLPLIGIGLVLQLIGVFAIAAITADVREGGGRTLGATLAAAVPAIGRFVLALLLFLVAYAVITIVLSLIVAIVGGIAAGGAPGAVPGAGGPDPLVLAKSVLAIVVPVMIWLWARLLPLVGVYLREPTGVVEGVQRAWHLSKGATWPILALLSVFLFATIIVGTLQVSAVDAVGPGLGGALANLVFAAIGTVFFVYAAAGTGVAYRQLTA